MSKHQYPDRETKAGRLLDGMRAVLLRLILYTRADSVISTTSIFFSLRFVLRPAFLDREVRYQRQELRGYREKPENNLSRLFSNCVLRPKCPNRKKVRCLLSRLKHPTVRRTARLALPPFFLRYHPVTGHRLGTFHPKRKHEEYRRAEEKVAIYSRRRAAKFRNKGSFALGRARLTRAGNFPKYVHAHAHVSRHYLNNLQPLHKQKKVVEEKVEDNHFTSTA